MGQVLRVTELQSIYYREGACNTAHKVRGVLPKWEGEWGTAIGGEGEGGSEKATPVAIEDARKLQSYIAAFEAEKHSAAVSTEQQ